MKRLFPFLTCALLICAMFVLSACQGTPKKVAYKTLSAVGTSVDSAMKAAAEAKVAGAIDQAAWDSIKAKHDAYQPAFARAVELAQFDYETAAPAQIAGLAAEIVAYIATLIPAR